MSGLYVKLDVEYMSNPRLLEAGPLAELIYVRSLCFAKRTMRDGFLSDSQTKLITFGVPAAKKHVESLVESGLWERVDSGGFIIAGWLERNKPAAQVEREQENKRQASMLANHERWHVGADGKQSPTCPLCHPELSPKSDPKPDPTRRSTESESETEAEEETKPEEETETSRRRPSTGSTAPADRRDDDDRMPEVIKAVTDGLVLKFPPKANPKSHRSAIAADVRAKYTERIRDFLAANPDHPAELVARRFLTEIA